MTDFPTKLEAAIGPEPEFDYELHNCILRLIIKRRRMQRMKFKKSAIKIVEKEIDNLQMQLYQPRLNYNAKMIQYCEALMADGQKLLEGIQKRMLQKKICEKILTDNPYSIALDLTEAQSKSIQEGAERLSLSPEGYARFCLFGDNEQPDDSFISVTVKLTPEEFGTLAESAEMMEVTPSKMLAEFVQQLGIL